MGRSRNKHNRNFSGGTKAQRQFQREGGRAIIGDPMGLRQNKHNRNFPVGTKAQDGRLVTLTLDLGLRHFKGKTADLLLEISLAIH